MEIISDLTGYELSGEGAVTIGKYDGIHRGHQLPLGRILEKKKEGLRPVVFTFNPSPAVFFGFADSGCLMTVEEKRRVFRGMGVEVLVEFPLNELSASMTPEAFIKDILVDKLHSSYICAGTDLSFGDKGAGNAQLLSSYGSSYGIEVDIIEKIRDAGGVISSSRIKKELALGHMETVSELIGYPYCITGTVVHGNHIGTGLGMPTVNLLPGESKLLPPKGVYYSYVSYNGRHYKSITNIGNKPTVSDREVMGVETYLYDFSEDIYEKRVSVNLLSFKRPEMKFESLEVLKRQMQEDIKAGREYHLR